MKILLNNREEEFPYESLTVSEMIDFKKFSFRMRIVKINGVLIPKGKYDSTIIHNNDEVQMLYLMSGG
ncbi:MAG: sulfur carrier protein ThiS [Bacteroidales bacterium]|nr:sulfur carrier protein ThiS [Bacteroidales bacterium]